MTGVPASYHRLSAEFWAIIGSAIAMGGLLYILVGGIPKDISDLRDDISDLRERMTRIETLIEVYVRGEDGAGALRRPPAR